MTRKVLGVVKLAWLPGTTTRVVLVPYAIRRGTTRSFRGIWCERAVVMPVSAFEKRGPEVLRELLGRAPLAEDATFDGHRTIPSEPFCELDRPMATAAAYVTAGRVGRIEIRPAKQGAYFSTEVLRFERIEPERFVTEMRRLLGPRPKAPRRATPVAKKKAPSEAARR